MGVYSVSSYFYGQAVQQGLTVARRLTIGNSDYSSRVVQWPKVSRSWNEIKPKNASVRLANEDGALSFLLSSPATLRAQCVLEMGIQYTASSAELFPVFVGTVGRLSYSQNGASATLTLVDKFKPFSERTVGSREAPADFTTSNYLPSDIAWILVTSYGGLSDVRSTSNPDIDWPSYLRWAEVFSSNTVLSRARFDGQKVTECLRKIGRMTGTSILEEGGKVIFTRFDLSSSAPFVISSAGLFDLSAVVDDEGIINTAIVNAAYDPSSKVFSTTVSDVVTYSVNSFGPREQIEEDKNVWYVNSVSALDFAQKTTLLKKEPPRVYTAEVGAQYMARQVGDTVSLNHGLLGVDAEPLRCVGYSLDMQTAGYTLELDASAMLTFFVLDDAVLGLLDQTNNILG